MPLKYYFKFLSAALLFSVSATAQSNEIPLIGLRYISQWTFLEKGNNFYFNNTAFGSKLSRNGNHHPLLMSVSKCDYATHRIVKSIPLIGDTVQADSIISIFQQNAAASDDKLFYAFNQYYFDDSSQHPHPVNSIVFVAIDTNLNLVTAPVRLKVQTEQGTTRFNECNLQSLTVSGSRLIIGYVSGDTAASRFGTSSLSRYLIIDQSGHILKDSIAGTIPNINPNAGVYHRLAEIVPYIDGKILITGDGIHNNGNVAKGFVIADSNMNVLDTFSFKMEDRFASSYKGYYYQFPNCVTLPTGSIIAGRDMITESGVYATLAKLTLATRYNAETVAVFANADTSNLHNSTPSLLNLGYNKGDNHIYYAFSDHRDYGYVGPCYDTLNYVQIISTDTNLHLRWRKFLSPAAHSCSYISRITVSENRSGIDVTGLFTDAVYGADTSLRGSFLYHVDSNGTLDVPDQQHFSIRDRFRVYPNPTSNIVRVDDALNAITATDIYNMQGQLVLQKKAQSGQLQISLADQPAGLYLIRLRLKDGTDYSVRIVRQ